MAPRPQRSPSGDLRPNAYNFPTGIEGVSSYIHKLGLRSSLTLSCPRDSSSSYSSS